MSEVDFFVSYTGADEAWATWIGVQLEAAGQRVRLQVWDSPAGENFAVWISMQMGTAARTIAVCSAAYFDSHWCTQEWTGALAGRKVIPLRVSDCTMPPVLATTSGRDLFGLDESAARRRLLEAVGLTTSARVATGGFPGAPSAAAHTATSPGRLPEVWDVPGRLASFAGRRSLLEQIHDQMCSGGRNAVTALHGLGGGRQDPAGGRIRLAVRR
jgi:TIR domain-containing protein